MGLLDDIAAETAAGGQRDYGCSACRALEGMVDETEREALRAALAGTMSERALLRISQKYDLGIGKAGIQAHRQEGH